MPIAGAAAGASQALEKILAEQMLRAQQVQRERENQQRMAMDQQRLDETIKQNQIANERQTRIDDEHAADRRQRSNQTGVRRMIGDSLMQRQGPMSQDDLRGIAAMQIEAGDTPNLSVLLPQPKKLRQVTGIGPKGQPINRMAPEDEEVEEYREPPRPSGDKGPYVVNGKLVGADGKVIYDGGAPGATGPSPYAKERAIRTEQSVDELLNKVSRWNTGMGSLLSFIPETDARDFSAELDTLKANVAFNELTQMREASKTGGALGSVAVREMELLQSALGALDAGQSPANLKAQLQKVRDSIGRWQNANGGIPAPGGGGAQRKPIPGIPGGIAELRDGKWIRVQ